MTYMMRGKPFCLGAFLVLLTLVVCYPCFADGGLFPLEIVAQPTVETGQRALLHVQEAGADAPNAYVIDLYLDVAYEGDNGDFAWVVPTPTLPAVATVEEGFFDELDTLTRPVIVYVDPSHDIGCPLMCAMSGEEIPTDDVVVWGTDTIGPYEYAILTAAGSEGLGAWLEDNGYALPAGANEVLDYYVQKESYFVAFKLSPDADAGPLSAVRLTYGADEIVYPLHITTLSTAEENQVTLHLMGCSGFEPVNADVVDIDQDAVAVDPETQSSNYEELFAQAVASAEGPVLVRESEIDFEYYQYEIENAQLESLLVSEDPCSCVVRFRTLLSPDEMAEDIAFVPRDADYLGTTITVFPEESKIRLGAMVALPVLLSWPMLRARKRTGRGRWSMVALLVLLLPLIMG